MKRQQASSKHGNKLISRSGDGLPRATAASKTAHVSSQNSPKPCQPSQRAKKKSPMERVEIVFGNLTNMELLSGKASPTPSLQRTAKSSKIKANDDFCALRMRKLEPIDMAEARDDITTSKHGVQLRASEQDLMQLAAASCSSYSHLTTQELLKLNNRLISCGRQDQPQNHCRSKTMPEIQNSQAVKESTSMTVSYNALPDNVGEEDGVTDQTSTIQQLRRENMILSAEKSGLQAELIFYKNELAKMCLSSGATFPIFRQPDTVSSRATSQILAKNSSTSNSYLQLQQTVLFQPSAQQSSSVATTSSEDRYEVFVSNTEGMACNEPDMDEQEAASHSTNSAMEPSQNEEDASTVKRCGQQPLTTYENLLPDTMTIEIEASKMVKNKNERSDSNLGHKPAPQQQELEHQVGADLSITQLPSKSTVGMQLENISAIEDTTMNNSLLILSPLVKKNKEAMAAPMDAVKPQQLFANKENSKPLAIQKVPSTTSSVQQVTVNLNNSRSHSNKLQSQNQETKTSAQGTTKRQQKQTRRKRSERVSSRQSSQQSKNGDSQPSPPADEKPHELYQADLMATVSGSNGGGDSAVHSVYGNIGRKERQEQVKGKSGHSANSAREPPSSSIVKTLDMDKCVVISLPTAQNSKNLPKPPALSSRDPVSRHAQSISCGGEADDGGLNPYQDIMSSSLTPSHMKSRIDAFGIAANRQDTKVTQPSQHEASTISSQQPMNMPDNSSHGSQPLDEKEKLLESSHQALKEKLAKVRSEIQHLSELQSSSHSAGAESRSLIEEDEGAVDTCSPEARQQEFEDEIQKLREQLVSFNEEEKKVMQELEVTKTLRKTVVKQQDGGTATGSEESFQLLPQQLNFDGCSQHSTGMLQSPMMGHQGVNLNFEMTQESQLRLCNTGRTPDSTEDICGLSSYRSNGLDKESYASDPIAVKGQETAESVVRMVENEALAPLNLDLKNLAEEKTANSIFVCKPRPQCLTTSGASLWINQIIEEEHESESAVGENSTNHSRCASNLQTKNNTTDQTKELDYLCCSSETVPETHIFYKLNEQLQRVAAERKSAGVTEYGGGASGMMEEHLSDIKLFNNVPGYDVDSSIGDKSPSETVNSHSQRTMGQKYQNRVLKREDGGDQLLQKISDNLEQLRSTENYSTRFAQLQQQQSPAELRPAHEYQSVETQKRVQQEDSVQTTERVNGNPSRFSNDNLSKSRNSNAMTTMIPSIEALSGNQIKILHQGPTNKQTASDSTLNPKIQSYVDEEQKEEFRSANSIEKLSKASPCFQEHSTFELTSRQMGETIKSCLQMSQGSIHRVGPLREHSFMEQGSGGGGIINASTNCLKIEKQQRSMFDQEAQKMYQSADSYGVEIDYTVESEQSIKTTENSNSSMKTRHRGSLLQLNKEIVSDPENIVDISDSRVTFARQSSEGVLKACSEMSKPREATLSGPNHSLSNNESSSDVLSKNANNLNKSSAGTSPHILSKSQMSLHTSTNSQTNGLKQPRPISAALLTQNRILTSFSTLRTNGTGTSVPSTTNHSRSLQLMKPVRQQTPTYHTSTHPASSSEPQQPRTCYNQYKRNLSTSTASASAAHANMAKTGATSTSQQSCASTVAGVTTAAPSAPLISDAINTSKAASHQQQAEYQKPMNSASGVRSKYPNSRKYESCYEDYINDNNGGNNSCSSSQLMAAKRVNLLTTSASSQAAPLSKTKSMSSLSSQLTSGQRPSPGLYRRNQETTLSGIVPHTKSIHGNAGGLSMSTASRSERQLLVPANQQHHDRHNSSITNTATSNSQKPHMKTIAMLASCNASGAARANLLQTDPNGPGKQISTMTGGTAPASHLHHHRTNTTSASASDPHKNVILFSDSGANQQQPQQRGNSDLPSYMQPIQSKFRKQTIQMVKEKEASAVSAKSASGRQSVASQSGGNNTSNMPQSRQGSADATAAGSAMVKQYRLYSKPASSVSKI